jgi:hypothetical protein
VLELLTLPVSVDATASTMVVRRTDPNDLRAIMRLLSDDPISATRGDVGSVDDEAAYREGLARIIADPGNDIVVAVDGHGAHRRAPVLPEPGLRRHPRRVQISALTS